MNFTEAIHRLGIPRATARERVARVGSVALCAAAGTQNELEPRELFELATITELRQWNRPFPRIAEALATIDWPAMEVNAGDWVLRERLSGFEWVRFAHVDQHLAAELAEGVWTAYYAVGPTYAELAQLATVPAASGAGTGGQP